VIIISYSNDQMRQRSQKKKLTNEEKERRENKWILIEGTNVASTFEKRVKFTSFKKMFVMFFFLF
jgi:hypothetical protein